MSPVELEGERVILRTARESDVPSIVAYYKENFEHLRKSMPKPGPTFFTEDHWRKQVEKNRDELERDQSVKLLLIPRDRDSVAGSVNLTQILRHPMHGCYLGYGIARALEGRGLMTEAVKLAIAHAFGTLELHRLSANYRPSNERSGRLLRKLGFVVEGYARDYLLLDGAFEDHVLTSLTNAAWRPD